MKTVKFFYKRTTMDLQVPDDTPVLLLIQFDGILPDRAVDIGQVK